MSLTLPSIIVIGDESQEAKAQHQQYLTPQVI